MKQIGTKYNEAWNETLMRVCHKSMTHPLSQKAPTCKLLSCSLRKFSVLFTTKPKLSQARALSFCKKAVSLMAEFPDMKGFSYRNLKYVRQWYQFYNEQLTIGQQVVAQLGDVNMQQPVAQISEEVFFSVPWGHHLYIISQCKDVNRAVFYLKKTVENGWSRAVFYVLTNEDMPTSQQPLISMFTQTWSKRKSASPRCLSLLGNREHKRHKL